MKNNIAINTTSFFHSSVDKRIEIELSIQEVKKVGGKNLQFEVGKVSVGIHDEIWGEHTMDVLSLDRLDMLHNVTFGYVGTETPHIHGRIAFLENFEIEKTERDRGLGTDGMIHVLQFLKEAMRVNSVVLKACPLIKELPHTDIELSEEEELENDAFIEKSKLWLGNFFNEKFGFELIQADGNCMGLDLDGVYFDDDHMDFLVEDGECLDLLDEEILNLYLENPFAKVEHFEMVKELTFDQIAKSLTHFAFRNGPIQDMHAEPNSQLSDDDMKKLNKFMVNRLAYAFQLILAEKWLEFHHLIVVNSAFGMEWDDAEVDDDGLSELFIKHLTNGMNDHTFVHYLEAK